MPEKDGKENQGKLFLDGVFPRLSARKYSAQGKPPKGGRIDSIMIFYTGGAKYEKV